LSAVSKDRTDIRKIRCSSANLRIRLIIRHARLYALGFAHLTEEPQQ
jgi:hypothetical protein